VISGDVEIGPVVVSHKNIVVETTPAAAPAGTGRFVPLDPLDAQNPTLKSLVQALNAVNVPTEDVIEIIKGLQRDGKLHGRLILQ
jgi:flagellar P-ring protein precursor FlgI